MKTFFLGRRPVGQWRGAGRSIFFLALLLGPGPRRAAAQAIASFTLLNADTGQPLAGYDPLPDGATLNLAALPTRRLGIRANPGPAAVGSVRFGFDGNAAYQQAPAAPFVLAWTPTVGPHTLTATPLGPPGGPPFPLGAFVGGPNGSDAAAQARLDAHYDHFAQLLGTAPAYMNAFVNYFKPIDDWAADVGWTAWSCAQAPRFRGLVPVVGLPMATAADAADPGPVFRDFAAGRYDGALRGMAKAWADHGFTTLYVRPGYEMNEPFMPWYAGKDAPTRAAWVAAFRRIADVLHGVAGATIKIVWNPNVRNYSGDLDVKSLYPGDGYVDVVGADLYSPMSPYDTYSWARHDGTFDATYAQWAADPANRRHYWDYPSANKWNPTGDGQGFPFSLQDAIDFAKAHGKPFGVPETGAGADGGTFKDGTHGPADDPAFPAWLAGKLAGAGVALAMVNVWDVDAGDADWTFSDAGRDGAVRPLEAAAWARCFGAQAPAAGPARTLAFTVTDAAPLAASAAAAAAAVQLYPNPARDQLTVGLPAEAGPPEPVAVAVRDALGRCVAEARQPGSALLRLPLGALPAGVYAVVVQRGARRSVHRLVVAP